MLRSVLVAVAVSSPLPLLPLISHAVDAPLYKEGELIVRFATGMSKTGEDRLARVHGLALAEEHPQLRCSLYRLPQGTTVQAALASLVTMALFLDIVANRKQVWLVIGLAAGLAYLARRGEPPPSDVHGGTAATGHPAGVGASSRVGEGTTDAPPDRR